jgi:hypothetical protein
MYEGLRRLLAARCNFTSDGVPGVVSTLPALGRGSVSLTRPVGTDRAALRLSRSNPRF